MDAQAYHHAAAILAWQVELGADEAIADAPVNRYELPAAAPKPAAAALAPAATPQDRAKPAAPMIAPKATEVDAVAVAQAQADGAETLEALKAALAAFKHCALKRGARNLVFSDGLPGARVMIVGEAPGKDEDREGRPFVGRAGQLLDRMFAAIGLARGATTPADAVYITNVLPWRPPQNRDPLPGEVAMMRPFLQRHIALARPEVLVIMGNISAQALLDKRGITRLRGNWETVAGLPAMPMCHPAYLLRTPVAKREAWADLLALKARLGDG